MWLATSGPTGLRSQVVVQLLPGAVVAPTTEVGPGRAPRDEVTRDHPPLSATPGHVTDGIDDGAQVGARPAKRFGHGQERLQDRPLGSPTLTWGPEAPTQSGLDRVVFVGSYKVRPKRVTTAAIRRART